jgi:hypothetical protein
MRKLMIISHKTIDKFILISSNTSYNIGVSFENDIDVIFGLSASAKWELGLFYIDGSEIIGVDDV